MKVPIFAYTKPLFVLFLASTALLTAPATQAGFSSFFDGKTLTLEQTVDDGAITLDNNGAGGAFRTVDGSGKSTYVAATHLVVYLLSGTSNALIFDLDNIHRGNVTLNLRNGARAINFIGARNSIGGNLLIAGGADAQILELAVNSNLGVAGSMTINLGTGIDSVDEDNNNISVSKDWTFRGVNFFENGGVMSVGGNVVVDSSVETEDTLFDDDNTMAITGNFTYTGGDGRDEVTMNGAGGGTTIGGSAVVNVGDNTTGGVQFILFNLPGSSVGGSMTVTSTAVNTLDSYSEHPSIMIGGNVSIDLGGGPNNAVFNAIHGGSTLNYSGGNDVDTVSYGPTTASHDATLSLGNDDNTLALTASVGGSLTINSGSGDDIVNVSTGGPINIGGALLVNLGSGVDMFNENDNDITVTGNMTFRGVNFFENGGVLTVGGNVVVDSSIETEDTLFDDDNTMAITGNFTYTGGDGRDEVTMNGAGGGTTIGGSAVVNVGDNTTGGVQFILFNLPGSSVGGSMTVTSTAVNTLDSYSEHPSIMIGGNVSIDLGGGPNNAVFNAIHGGSTLNYSGGNDVDTVSYGPTTASHDATLSLGNGDNVFSLIAPVSGDLTVNAGTGVDRLDIPLLATIGGTFTADMGAGIDTLRFVNFGLDQVVFVNQTNNGDLLSVFSGGLILTIEQHFSGNNYGIERLEAEDCIYRVLKDSDFESGTIQDVLGGCILFENGFE